MQSDKNYRLIGADKLRVTLAIEDVIQRVQIIKNIMKQLSVN